MPLDESIPHSDITYKIIGAAMRVHNKIGPGHKESFYQRLLTAEMREDGLRVEEERPFDLYVDGTFVGRIYLDHLVEEIVIVEDKAFSHLLTDEEVAQVIAYLAATGLKVGLLFNFGRKRLQYKRILPPKKLEGWQERIQRYLWKPEA
ncbi:MAG: GxxExxY protein [Anaerolineae bacterium]